jgi:hypothetical protein
MMVAAALLVAACSNGSDETEQRTTVPTAPALTTTTNPYAVPEVIDAAYVNRVLAGLDAAVGDVVRMVANARAVTPEAYDRLKALYSDEEARAQANGLILDAAEGFPGFRGGNRKSTVSRILTGAPTCIFAEVSRDMTPVAENPSPDLAVQWVGLRPLDVKRDPSHYNPTPWMFVYDGYKQDRSQPANPCVAS